MAHSKTYSSYINNKYNNLLINSIYRTPKKVFAVCTCDCGKTTNTPVNDVVKGKVKSCKTCSSRINGRKGLLSKSNNSKYNNIIGTTLNYFTVIRRAIDNEPAGTFYCQCICGNVRFLDAHELVVTQDRKSCGCQQSRLISLKNGGTGIPHSRISVNEFIRKNTLEYSRWIKDCLSQAQYTCYISGIRGGNLVVHHLIPLAKLIKDNSITVENYKDYSNILFDITNGLVLDSKIHIKLHSMYGNTVNIDTINRYKLYQALS